MMQYILDDDDNPIPCNDLLTWGKWLEENHARKRVELDIIEDVRVSTVFLGLDHNYFGGPPVLYETMIFGGKHDQYQERYCTKEEALAGHAKAVYLVTMGD